MIRLGEVDYINALPLCAWEAPADGPRLLRHRDTPSRLFAMLNAGELDVSPISSVAYWQSRAHLTLIPDLCISAAGPVQSVTLYARLPLAELAGQRIGVTPASLSSVALLKFLLSNPPAATFEVSPEATLLTFPSRYAGILLIGDAALTTRYLAPPPPAWQAHDLAELWWQQTGLPMVFAVWAARRDWAAREPAAFDWLHAQLVQALDRFHADPEPVLQQAARRLPIPREALQSYYRGLEFRLGALQLSGLERFSSAAIA